MNLFTKESIAYFLQVVAVILLFAFAAFPAKENTQATQNPAHAFLEAGRLPLLTVKNKILIIPIKFYQPVKINPPALPKSD